jgi:hypothetical protein
VKEYVSTLGGIVSEHPNLAGTLDALSRLIERMSASNLRPARTARCWYAHTNPWGAGVSAPGAGGGQPGHQAPPALLRPAGLLQAVPEATF